MRIDGRPENVRACAEASLRRLRRRRDRPLLPAPGRPPGADRGHRRRDGRAGAAGQGPPPRAVGGQRRVDPPGRRGAPDRRAAERVVAVDPRPRRTERARRGPRARHRHRAVQPARPRLPHRRDHQPRRLRRRRLPARTTRASPGEAFTANLRLVDAVRELAAEKGCTPGQLALAWVLAQGEDVVPIPGTKRRAYLEENAGAAAVELTRATTSPGWTRSPRPGPRRAAGTPTPPTPTATARSAAGMSCRPELRGGARDRGDAGTPTGCWSRSSPPRSRRCCSATAPTRLPHRAGRARRRAAGRPPSVPA